MASLTNTERARKMVRYIADDMDSRVWQEEDDERFEKYIAAELDDLEKHAFNMACRIAIDIASEKMGHLLKEPMPGHLIVARIKSRMMA